MSGNPYQPPSPEAVGIVTGSDDLERPLASFRARFFGAVADGLLYIFPLAPTLLASTWSQAEPLIGVLAMLSVLGILGLWIYQMYLISTTGQSLGKRHMKTRIIRETGQPVDFLTGVFLRSWLVAAAGIIPGVGNFVLLVDSVVIFGGDKRQCIHDMLAKTIVIDVSDRKPG